MIELKHVSKVYDNGTHALDDVSITIDDGEFVFVVGASGAGKSTFLKLMMREEVPSGGSIHINDYDLGKLKKRQIPHFRRTMGIVFQDFRLIPTMTVYDNVAFAMRVIGTKESQIRRRVTHVLNLVGLGGKARCYPKELSGGEQQRVALARALSNSADLIIADEPTGNVDPQMSHEIVELLTKLNEAGKTVIMVTHEHDLVRQFDKRVIILENGRVVHDGSTKDSEEVLQSSQGHLDRAHLESFDSTFAISTEDSAKLDKSISKFNDSLHKKNTSDSSDFTVYVDKSKKKNKKDE